MRYYIAGFLFGSAFFWLGAVAFLLLFGCGAPAAQLEPDASVELPALDAPPALEMPEPAEFEPTALLVTPAPELLDAVEQAADAYWDVFGLRVEIVPSGGIPITVVPSVTWKDVAQDAVSHCDVFCSGYECDVEHGVYIRVSEALLGEKNWALLVTIEHELGHIFSGWGVPAGLPMHLPDMQGRMAPGCRNHVCAPWTSGDVALICAGAPCGTVQLP